MGLEGEINAPGLQLDADVLRYGTQEKPPRLSSKSCLASQPLPE